MSSGESGDESSGIESPGPIGTVPGASGVGSSGIQVAPNSIDMVRHQQQDQHHQQQNHAPNSSQQHDDSSKGLNSNNMGSLLYPAAALANLPQEVLLSLVQGGHLQIHQEDGKRITHRQNSRESFPKNSAIFNDNSFSSSILYRRHQ